jgi:hypothetical protein
MFVQTGRCSSAFLRFPYHTFARDSYETDKILLTDRFQLYSYCLYLQPANHSRISKVSLFHISSNKTVLMNWKRKYKFLWLRKPSQSWELKRQLRIINAWISIPYILDVPLYIISLTPSRTRSGTSSSHFLHLLFRFGRWQNWCTGTEWKSSCTTFVEPDPFLPHCCGNSVHVELRTSAGVILQNDNHIQLLRSIHSNTWWLAA